MKTFHPGLSFSAVAIPFGLATILSVAASAEVFPQESNPESRTKPALSKTLDRAAPSNEPTAGSLWSGQIAYVDLFTDLRAQGIGDLVTIRIIENVRAQQAAETDASREANINLGISQLFGLQNYAPDNLGLSSLVGAASASDFKGGGSNSRTNALSTTITATVVEVGANGQLVVEATRFLKVNHEEENLTLRGTVRTADISPRNVVLSTALANVEIRYGGKGVIGSNLKPGILMRIARFLF